MQDIPLGRQGLLDMSAIVWAGLLVGEDKEFGRKVLNDQGKEVQVNSHTHGAWNATEHILHLMREYKLVPRDLIMVMDGEDAKRLRRSMFADYKAGRDKVPELYVEFNKAMETVKQQFLAVGASAVQQQYREADDVLAYLALNLPCPVVISSVDNDLAVLQSDRIKTYIGNNENYNKYGLWPAKYISLYKALVGDSSDNIKGVKGFGDVAFQKLYTVFGEEGLDCMIDLLNEHALDRLVEDVDQLKELSKILADQEGAYLGWNLARLYPEKINTGRCPLTWEVGMVKPFRQDWTDSRLAKWSGRVTLVHGGNYEAALNSARRWIAPTPWVALDIETSTGEESDEWLAAKNRAREADEGKGVDVLGSELTGMSITFGDNGQYTVYMTHDHVEQEGVPNLSVDQIRAFTELWCEKTIVVQNASFELSVLERTWGVAWKDNGFEGFLPNILDTKIEANYVNENVSSGLKQNSKLYLNYDQTTYDEVTQGRKMNQLTAQETVAYGADDTICTAALHQHYMRVMLLEQTWNAYREVEIDPIYLTAQAFNRGQKLSLEKLLELEAIDLSTREKSWALLRDYLIQQGWDGSVCPVYGPEAITAAQIKEAYLLVTGEELETQVRTPSKLATMIAEAGHYDLAEAVNRAAGHDFTLLNATVKANFSGEPALNLDSPKQVQKLLYETMKLPMRLRNKPTDGMRQSVPALKKAVAEAKQALAADLTGEFLERNQKTLAEAEKKLDVAMNGNPMTDDTAVEFALAFDIEDRPEMREILKAFAMIKIVDTRSKLYYRPYRHVLHWKDGNLHTSVNQCATVTRRHTSTDPNAQQVGKRARGSDIPRIREAFVPHCKDAVVVSIDFKAQEIVSGAWQSKDENMLACFVGDVKKDLHILTGVGILNRKPARDLWEYTGSAEKAEGGEFVEAAKRWKAMDYSGFEKALHDKKDPDHPVVKVMRNVIAKPVNFGGMYNIQAKKLSYQLIDTEENCQTYLDAKQAAFPGYEKWQESVRKYIAEHGYVTTLMGARRHLAESVFSGDGFERSRAERQGPNFCIQGSCGEQTRLAMGRVWRARTFDRYNARWYFPVHDETVFSVHKDDAIAVIKEVHLAMSQKYATQDLPAVASISLGLNWREQIECGDYFDEAAIQRALDELFGASNG